MCNIADVGIYSIRGCKLSGAGGTWPIKIWLGVAHQETKDDENSRCYESV